MKIFSRKMYCEPLTCNEKNKKLLDSFFIEREKEVSKIPDRVVGLQAYLQRCAWKDDENNIVKIYLIKTYFTNEVVAYFGLRACMVSVDTEYRDVSAEKNAKINGIKLLPKTISSLEISHFAVNDAYKNKHKKNGKPLAKLGAYLYPTFIYPIIKNVSSKVGIKLVCLYAAGDENLE